jgi:hypothetical protein
VPQLARLGIRLTPSDAAALDTIAEALRTSRRTSFVSITDATTAAIRAAAQLAREGALAAVLASSRG